MRFGWNRQPTKQFHKNVQIDVKMPAGKLIRWVFTFLGEGSMKHSLNETQDEQQQQKGTIMNRIFEEFLLDCRMSTKMLDSSHVHSVLRQ